MINKYINKEEKKGLLYRKMSTNKDKRNNGLEESFYNHCGKNNSGKNYEWMLDLESGQEWNTYSISKYQVSSHILLISYQNYEDSF